MLGIVFFYAWDSHFHAWNSHFHAWDSHWFVCHWFTFIGGVFAWCYWSLCHCCQRGREKEKIRYKFCGVEINAKGGVCCVGIDFSLMSRSLMVLHWKSFIKVNSFFIQGAFIIQGAFKVFSSFKGFFHLSRDSSHSFPSRYSSHSVISCSFRVIVHTLSYPSRICIKKSNVTRSKGVDNEVYSKCKPYIKFFQSWWVSQHPTSKVLIWIWSQGMVTWWEFLKKH